MNWYKKANKKYEDNSEEKKFFLKRTKKHISLVEKSCKKIVDKYPEFKELIERSKEHDASKFEEPELTPYISLTWRKNIKGKNLDNKNLLSKEEENEATLHHIKNNSHHPEYHNKDKANISSTNRDDSVECIKANNMDDISLAEMVADWQAMAEELGTNTSREWYDKVKDVRWSFSKKQEKLIDKLLKVFEK